MPIAQTIDNRGQSKGLNPFQQMLTVLKPGHARARAIAVDPQRLVLPPLTRCCVLEFTRPP
jgi:hypothetical protein